MIRTDDDFQPTTWAVQSDDHWPPRRVHYGLGGLQTNDDFANPPQAAHAASELDDEPDTHDNSGGAIVWPLLIAAVASVAALVHLAAWLGWV